MLKQLSQWGQPLWVLFLWVGIQLPQPQGGINLDVTLAQTNVPESICPQELATQIDKIVQRPEFVRSHWGILIQPLNSNSNLYALNSQKYFVPASNIKLLTTAAALLEFGSQFRFRTPIYSQGNPPDLDTLKIIGQGDPTLTTAHLKSLAQQLKQQGVQRIEKLIVQDGYFKDGGIPVTWEWEDLFFSYGVPANSLVLNENAFALTLTPRRVGIPLRLSWSDPIAARQWQMENLTTTTPGTDNNIEIKGFLGQSRLSIRGTLGSDVQPTTETIAIIDPTSYFLDTLEQVLESEGIAVIAKQVISQDTSHPNENAITFIESPSLADIVQKVNQDSHNLFAETLLKLLEIKSNESDKMTILQQRLTQLGIDLEGYRIVDGSGLSRHNLATPTTFVTLLQKMSQTPQGNSYRNSLAVSGSNGTLAKRFKETSVQGRLQAKTGTLTGVSALSGYLDIPSYETVVFSIMVNASEQPVTNLRQGIDEIILLLGQMKRCN